MREPAFWWRPRGGTGAALLAPLALLYGAVAQRRLPQASARVRVPVVLWLLLLSGAVGTVGSMYLFGVDAFWPHAAMTNADTWERTG